MAIDFTIPTSVNLLPETSLTSNIGSPSLKFNSVYADTISGTNSQFGNTRLTQLFVARGTGGDSFLNVSGSLFQIGNMGATYTNAVPPMTSNTAPTGVASGSSFFPLTPYYMSFNGVAYTGWLTNGTPSGFLTYEFPTAQVIKKYSIIPWSYDTPPPYARSPYTWTMEGSNNGTSWTVLDTRTAFSAWTAYVPVEFGMSSNSTAYKYYKMNVSANGGGGYMGVQNLALYTETVAGLLPKATFNSGSAEFSGTVVAASGVFSSQISGTNFTAGSSLIIPMVVPASGTAIGIIGQIAASGSFLYVCSGTNQWGRVALTAF